MTDTERVTQALTGKAPSPERAEAVRKLFLEISTAYGKGAAKSVAAALQGEITLLNGKFDSAFTKLEKKMGL